jgi:hypothetical protein
MTPSSISVPFGICVDLPQKCLDLEEERRNIRLWNLGTSPTANGELRRLGSLPRPASTQAIHPNDVTAGIDARSPCNGHKNAACIDSKHVSLLVSYAKESSYQVALPSQPINWGVAAMQGRNGKMRDEWRRYDTDLAKKNPCSSLGSLTPALRSRQEAIRVSDVTRMESSERWFHPAAATSSVASRPRPPLAVIMADGRNSDPHLGASPELTSTVAKASHCRGLSGRTLAALRLWECQCHDSAVQASDGGYVVNDLPLWGIGASGLPLRLCYVQSVDFDPMDGGIRSDSHAQLYERNKSKCRFKTFLRHSTCD